jgi:hypothetical protein
MFKNVANLLFSTLVTDPRKVTSKVLVVDRQTISFQKQKILPLGAIQKQKMQQ